jgi:integrase
MIIQEKNKAVNICKKCGKILEKKDMVRSKIEWRINPLSKEQIEPACIRIISGKGEKDRIVPRPKRMNAAAIEMLPLKIKRRALQSFVTELARKVLNKEISFHCVDEKTKILTKEGWKKYNEIEINEEIYTLNLKKDIIELKKIIEVFKHEFMGELYYLKNRYIDSLITEDHKLPLKISVSKRENKNYWTSLDLIKIKDLIYNIKSKRDVLYKLSSYKKEGKSIGKEKAGLLGWILSDSHIAKDGDVTIQQSLTANKDKCEIISKLLKDSGLNYYIKIQKKKISDYSKRESQIIIFRISKKDTNWIYEYINKDRTPKNNLLLLKGDELKEIYKNMMLGDGTRGKEYCGQNKKRIEFFRILCCFLRKRTGLGIKIQKGSKYSRIYISDGNYCQLNWNKDIFKKKYKGIVWCPSTENGTFIAKRNEKIFITGNTLRHGFGSHLASAGRPLHEIQMLMGHSSISTTGIYLHANPKAAIEGARDVF